MERLVSEKNRCDCQGQVVRCLPNTSSLAASYNAEKSVPRSKSTPNQPAHASKRVNQENFLSYQTGCC